MHAYIIFYNLVLHELKVTYPILTIFRFSVSTYSSIILNYTLLCVTKLICYVLYPAYQTNSNNFFISNFLDLYIYVHRYQSYYKFTYFLQIPEYLINYRSGRDIPDPYISPLSI